MLPLSGIATRDQLLVHGMTPAAITFAVRSGMLVRLRRAWYATPGTPFEHRVAISLGGRVGGVSAGRSYGMWTGLDTGIHVSWAPHGNVARPGRRLAYPTNRELADRVIVPHWRLHSAAAPGEPWRESPGEALRQTFRSCELPLAVAMADSARRLGLVSAADTRRLLRSLPARFAPLGPAIDGRPDSGLEAIVRLWLLQAGIPFRLHPVIRGFEVDFLIERSLIVETDGREFHSGEAFERDRARDLALGTDGYVTIRLSYRQVLQNWAECEQRILAAIARGDHRRVIA